MPRLDFFTLVDVAIREHVELFTIQPHYPVYGHRSYSDVEYRFDIGLLDYGDIENLALQLATNDEEFASVELGWIAGKRTYKDVLVKYRFSTSGTGFSYIKVRIVYPDTEEEE